MNRTKLVLVLIFVVLGMYCSNAIAIAPLGPPVSNLAKGQNSIGIAYTYSEMDLHYDNGVSPGGGPDFTLDSIKSNVVFIDLARGITEKWEAYLRFGVGSTRTSDKVGTSVIQSHNPESGYAIGFGTKYTFCQPRPELKFGGIFQMLWAKVESEASIAGNKWNTKTDMTEIELAIGPEYRINGKLSLYGGAFLHIVDGQLDGDRKNSNAVISYDIDQSAIAGGYMGTSIDVTENMDLNLEWQHTRDLDLAGIKLIYKF